MISMVLYASQIQQQIMMQQMAAAQQMQHANQLSQAYGTAPHMSALGALQHGQGGIYGEQAATRMANVGQTAIGLGGMGLGIAGMFTGLPLDPVSAAMRGGSMGFRMAGMGGAMMGGALAMAPFYAAGQTAAAYGGAFHGGMQQQSAMNSVLRSSFNFQGGQGAFGRGFSQQQMGQIGQMVSQEARQSPFTSSQELNQLISGGAESGMFTAVRDVQQFAQRFKAMIDGLRKIQKELGGTLTEALAFTRGSQQLGIFSAGGRQAFAGEMRDTMSATGMSQDQLFGLAAQGSMLSRATGGFGRQGATGALRMARTLGSAVSSGAINAEALSEATGGLTGTDAIQAFTGRILQQSERFSRRGMGRFSIFALSNAEGTGLDSGAVDRFMAGDLSVSEVSQTAHKNVNRMGRARAMNREGMLRGALLEQGGLAGQIGMMRLMVGDRIMDQSDDLASQVLQRRFGMNRPESEMMMSLMRNQGSIARQESVDRALAGRETRLKGDISENRSLDAFMEHLQHGIQDATGVTRVREMGRNFMTKISGLAERAMNDVLGIQASSLTTNDNLSLQRLAMGQATSDDIERLRFSKSAGGGSGQTDVFSKPLAQRALQAMGFHSTMSVGETMAARGVDLRGLSAQQRDTAIRAAEQAQRGVVRGADATQLEHLMSNQSGTVRRLVSAELSASMRGEAGQIYGSFGDVSANALDAFRKRNGLGGGLAPNTASLLGQGGGSILGNLGGIGAQALQGLLLGGGAGMLAGGPIGAVVGGIGGAVGFGALEAVRSLDTDQDRAMSFLASGGHFGKRARAIGDAAGEVQRLGGKAGKALQRAAARSGISLDEAVAMSLRGSEGVDPKLMAGVIGSEDFQTSLRRVDALQGNQKAQLSALSHMEQMALRQEGPQKEAALLAVRQLQHNIKNMGGIGSEFRNAMGNTAREREMLQRFGEFGSQYADAALATGGALGDKLMAISGQFYGGGDPGGIQKSIGAIQDQLASLDPNSQEYRDLIGGLGKTDIGRELLAGGRAQAAFVKDASGGGRRGRYQQAETVLGAATGGALGSMEFSIGGRRVSRRNKDEAKEIYAKFNNDPELQRIRREGMEKMQRDRDPLGVERNDLLKSIKDGVTKMANRDPSGLPMSGEG
jgi:hypothetical protein